MADTQDELDMLKVRVFRVNAPLVELVDTPGLGPGDASHESSSLLGGTKSFTVL